MQPPRNRCAECRLAANRWCADQLDELAIVDFDVGNGSLAVSVNSKACSSPACGKVARFLQIVYEGLYARCRQVGGLGVQIQGR
jgi:hypothetical protein